MVAFFWVVGKFNLLEADTCHGNTVSVPLSTLVSVICLRALGHWPTRTVSARFKCREFEVRALPSDPTKDIIKALWGEMHFTFRVPARDERWWGRRCPTFDRLIISVYLGLSIALISATFTFTSACSYLLIRRAIPSDLGFT